jgi:hypothetical protein
MQRLAYVDENLTLNDSLKLAHLEIQRLQDKIYHLAMMT